MTLHSRGAAQARLGTWLILALVLLWLPSQAAAWWNNEWSYRKKIRIDTSATGAALSQPVAEFALPVRLHTGNFLFADARSDGADIRFIASDDATPLKFHVEKFDGLNEIAVFWVTLPDLAPDSSEAFVWMYYGNQTAPPAADPRGSYDINQALVFHFTEGAGNPKDVTGYENHGTRASVKPAAGMIDAGIALDANSSVVIPAAPSLAFEQAAGFTFSAWLRIGDPIDKAAGSLLTRTERGEKAPRLAIGVDDSGRIAVQFVQTDGKPARLESSTPLAPGKWAHIAVTLSDRVAILIDGREAGVVAAKLAPMSGDVVIGAAGDREAVRAELDELQLANVVRSPAWLAAVAASHPEEGRLLQIADADESVGGGDQYLTILSVLASAVSRDGWIIIALVALIGLLSTEVIVRKSLLLRRIERGNEAFLSAFHGLGDELDSLDRGMPDDRPKRRSERAGGEFADSSAYRIYVNGLAEMRRVFARDRALGREETLTAEKLEVIKSALEATIVREAARMNKQLVTLTLAVSGAPFLGLLGTVVGIMITFAAIAMAGDVNVNTIAPGVAAALSTTVAGLIVAIPSMFGYNHLATRIKELVATMETFANEYVGRLAMAYAR